MSVIAEWCRFGCRPRGFCASTLRIIISRLHFFVAQAALNLFETEWEQLIDTPSSRSAEPEKDIQEDRSTALAAALEKGFIDNYEGWRKSFKGNRVMIRDATLFNVEAPNGDRVGQAVIIRAWEYEDGRVGGTLAVQQQESNADGNNDDHGNTLDETARQKQIEDGEQSVREQADVVRGLKEGEGLSNSDPKVKEAVAELLSRKERLAELMGEAELS